MPTYTVTNTQTIEADSAFSATQKAWNFLRNDGSIANTFTVQDEAGAVQTVDLMAHYGDDGRPEDFADLFPQVAELLEQAYYLMPLGTKMRADWIRSVCAMRDRIEAAENHRCAI